MRTTLEDIAQGLVQEITAINEGGIEGNDSILQGRVLADQHALRTISVLKVVGTGRLADVPVEDCLSIGEHSHLGGIFRR